MANIVLYAPPIIHLGSLELPRQQSIHTKLGTSSDQAPLILVCKWTPQPTQVLHDLVGEEGSNTQFTLELLHTMFRSFTRPPALACEARSPIDRLRQGGKIPQTALEGDTVGYGVKNHGEGLEPPQYL